jgi:hypothetical protein
MRADCLVGRSQPRKAVPVDFQSVINLGAGAALTAIGWFARQLWEANKEIRADLAKLREELPKFYVSKDDFRDAIREVKELLIGIDNKLDRKQDKA